MDPWSKVDYSRLIREVSMAMEKLPEMNPPSDRVRGQGLLAAPILKRWRRWNKGEIAEKGSVLEGFFVRDKCRRTGAAKGGLGSPGAPRRVLGWDRATRAPRPLVGPPGPPSGIPKLPSR